MATSLSHLSAAAALQERTAALVALFEHVGVSRMNGVPILNPALQVAAIGFSVVNEHQTSAHLSHDAVHSAGLIANADNTLQPADPPAVVGILITPWFMNLLWFPLKRTDAPEQMGATRSHVVGSECFDFIAGHEAAFGNYDACSLFSPMFEFPDQATAAATAQSVLDTLRKPPPAKATQAAAHITPVVADRRAFLFGRRAPPSDVAS